MKLTLEKAQRMIEAAMKKAVEMKIPQNIAIVDSGANLVAFVRMDGAMLAGVNVAVDKAYSAAATTFPTDALQKLAQPGGPSFGLANSDRGRMTVFPGGLPIKVGDETIGGIGCSGGMPDDDKTCAQAGLDALGE